MMYKSILITGASSGIGRSLALRYATANATLFLLARDEQRLHNVAELCQINGAKVFAHCVDVTNADAMRVLLLRCDECCPLDLVIANAGMSDYSGVFDAALSQKIFNVNLQGVLNTIHPLIARMQERKHGHLALMSSLAGFQGMPHNPAYCAAKAAVRIYAEGLSGALQQDGITVSVICPGFIKTPMTDRSPYPMPFLMDVDKAAKIIQQNLSRKKMMIKFPWPMAVLVYLGTLLPRRLLHLIIQIVRLT